MTKPILENDVIRGNMQRFNDETIIRDLRISNHRLRRAIEEALLELGDPDTCTSDRIFRVYSILNVAIRRNND